MGGYSKENDNPPIEIIDLINTKLKSRIVVEENGPKSYHYATGGILQNQPLIFGGIDSTETSIENVSIIGMPNHSSKMMILRNNMSSIVLNKSKIYITGGNGGLPLPLRCLKSTEIHSLDQPPVPGPDLPFIVDGHSMVMVDPKTIYLIGGTQNGQTSNKTWIIDPTNDFQIKVGPSLNIARYCHSCSKMRIGGRIFLVAAGGMNSSHGKVDSVEVLDTTCPEQGWKMGITIGHIFQNIMYK